MDSLFRPGGTFTFTCRNPDGTVAWTKEAKNGITNEGLNHALNVIFAAASQVTTWYIGLISSGASLAAADTMSSHAGWTENTTYDEANRPTYTEASSTAQSTTNSASPATFTMSGSTTVYGAFVTSNNTKSGTTGTLWATGAFDSPQSLVDNQILEVTYTCGAASA